MKRIILKSFLSSMKFLVFTLIRKIHQIFKSIIIFNTIDMMNSFYWLKKSTKIFFYNQTRLLNIIMSITKWMIERMYINISSRFSYSPFPRRTFFSSISFFIAAAKKNMVSFIPRKMTFFKMCLSSIKTNTFCVWKMRKFFIFKAFPITLMRTKFTTRGRFIKLKFFITNNTNSFKHNILQKIRAFFNATCEKRLSFIAFTKSPILAIKKPLLTSIYIIIFFSSFVNNSFAISDWMQGTGDDAVTGTQNVSDLDSTITNYLQDPLDKVLSHGIWGCTLSYTSDDVITVSVGEVVCSNGAGTIRRMRKNTSTTTVDFTGAGVGGIDSGSARDDSSWFDIYAVADANATTFTAIAATQGTALSDVTYYRYIGSVYNNASDNILKFYWIGSGVNPLIMWDVPVTITSTLSIGAWSSALSCSTGMPSSSTCAIFGVRSYHSGSQAGIYLRPNAATWSTTDYSDGRFGTGNAAGQMTMLTDSSQRIQYYNDTEDSLTTIKVLGFYISR